MDRWLEYQGFSRVAATRSFTAAAAELGVSASAVSRQVRALEERLGVRLLHRTTRRVSLTAEGRAFFDRLGPVLSDVEEAEQAVSQLTAELRGSLRIGAPMDFGRAHLAGPLAQFAVAHPQISLEVELTDRFVDVVEERFDLVVRIGRLANSSLVARRLAPCRRVLCASPAYLAHHGLPRAPGDLKRHVRIGYAYEAEASWRFRGERGPERIAVPVAHRTNNGQMLVALARQGLGIGLIPTFLVANDLREGRLQVVLPEALIGETAIHAVYPHRRLLSNKVRRLVDFLVDRFGERPYWDAGLPLPSAGARGEAAL